MNKPLSNKSLQRYIVKKVVMASSLEDALKRERGVPVLEAYVEEEKGWRPSIGYNPGPNA